eukprot:gnl/MRDRNA2_/MRDRNA2_64869_c0_seq1.p1 gnl/MRDRNA2_/MRDRNA2_64869_c0~~gnl/MRDRNA2_/MRDRNA2_64869_c0_seq1.p1  ORF type:complete len:167 (+),score=13.90 gnl/MRDRNA2_/MRDRNA2_64869_c0_seq1:175-675(+)
MKFAAMIANTTQSLIESILQEWRTLAYRDKRRRLALQETPKQIVSKPKPKPKPVSKPKPKPKPKPKTRFEICIDMVHSIFNSDSDGNNIFTGRRTPIAPCSRNPANTDGYSWWSKGTCCERSSVSIMEEAHDVSEDEWRFRHAEPARVENYFSIGSSLDHRAKQYR